MTRQLRLSLGACALAVTALVEAQTPIRLFVSVLDRTGAPVLTLQPGDFVVRHGGAPQRIVRASLATDPMRIGLLVDTSDGMSASLNPLREGLAAFIDAIPAEHEIAIISIGRQARPRVPPTLDRTRLQREVAGLFPDGGSPVLIDAMREVWDRFLKNAENKWPVFVIVTTDSTDSSGNTRDHVYQRFMADLQLGAATAHSLILSQRGGGLATQVGLNLKEALGGRFESIAAATALPSYLKALGQQIKAHYDHMRQQYIVEFTANTRDRAGTVEVMVTHESAQIGLSQTRGLP